MLKKITAAATLVLGCVAVQAAPITYIGADNNVTSLAQMVNAQAAAADFISITGDLAVYNFDSAAPANLTIDGGTTTNVSGCGTLCGFNTSLSGSNFRSVYGGSVTFTFANPVDAFGFYVNGLQTEYVSQQTIVYTDGSLAETVINFPSATNGGGAFIGFIDYGKMISSVTFNASNDILGFDDLRFGRSAKDPSGSSTNVPEPATLALLGLGLMGVGLSRRRKLS